MKRLVGTLAAAVRADRARRIGTALPIVAPRPGAARRPPRPAGAGHSGQSRAPGAADRLGAARFQPAGRRRQDSQGRANTPSTKLLAVVFESNHCPVSQLYESRIEKLYEDYRRKGVTLVAINPNNPKTVRLDELGYTDVTDSLPGDEAARAAARHRLAVPVRRRHPGDLDQVRRGGHAPHLHLRPAAQAPVPGPDRRQPARRAREDAGRPERASTRCSPTSRCRSRRPPRSAAPRNGCRRHRASSRSGRGSRPSRSTSRWSAPRT